MIKLKPIYLYIIIIAGALWLSGCAGGRGSVATGWPGLTVDAETAYLAHTQQVYAINLANGQERWRFPATADGNMSFFAAPTLTSDGQLIVGGYNNILYSLNPTSGTENWQFTDAADRYIGSSLAVDRSIFAPNADKNLYALDLDGNLVWKFASQEALWAKPTTDPACTCVYLTSMDHRIYSLDAQDGSVNWQTDGLGGSLVGTPALSEDGILYVGTYGSDMLAINADNGDILWRIPTSDWVWGGPILRDGVLYFGVLDGNFYALDASTGTNIWGPFQAEGKIPESPLVTEDAIYFTTDNGNFYGLNLDGSQLPWSPKVLDGILESSPVQAGDLILITQSGSDKILIAFNQNGSEQWAFTPEKK